MEIHSQRHRRRLCYHCATIAIVYIGIGSNIDAEQNLESCAEMLRADYPDIQFSSIYKTAAMDVTDQEDFLNAVAVFETEETPEEIRLTLNSIEQDLFKNPPYDKGPRTIDLDVLLYDNLQQDDPELTLPHPRMTERRFVLEPLCELDPSWEDALQKTLDQACENTGLTL